MEEKYISLWDKSAEENDYAGHVETTRDADVIVVDVEADTGFLTTSSSSKNWLNKFAAL